MPQVARKKTPRTFGDELRAELAKRDLSARGLAKLLADQRDTNVEQERRTVGRWLKSVDGPTDESRGRLASALELPPDHPLIRDRPRAAVLGVLAQLEARVERIEGRLDALDAGGGHRGPRAAGE